MKKNISLFVMLLLAGQLTYAHKAVPQGTDIDARSLVERMLNEIEQIRTMTFTLKSWERIDDETIYSEVDGKLQEKPKKKMYLLSKAEPNEGVEVLWVEGEREGKAYVNPNKWLIPSLKLDPAGGRMRNDQHHTVLSSGFGMLHGIVSDAVQRVDAEAPGQFEEVFQLKGTYNYLGKPCYKLEIIDPTFSYKSYTVKPGENAVTLENDKNICAYLIVEKNDHIKDFDDIEPGVTLQIPTSYAPTTVLYIDKSNFMPIGQIMSDSKGQFERYEFHNLKLNPTIKDAEFTSDYDAYNF